MTDQKTLSQLASDALMVQNACNLTAVLRSAHEAARTLLRHPDSTGTDWVNQHPVMVLYADKIASLTGCNDIYSGNFDRAYDACESLAKDTQNG